jgi:hypothetical protein
LGLLDQFISGVEVENTVVIKRAHDVVVKRTIFNPALGEVRFVLDVQRGFVFLVYVQVHVEV